MKTPFVSQISVAIAILRHLTQVDVQPDWRYCAAELTVATATQSDLPNWQTVQLNKKHHITWIARCQVLWLRQ